MYISKIKLNTKDSFVKEALRDVYKMHQLVMTAFPSPINKKERVLYRLELHNSVPYLLIQSLFPQTTDSFLSQCIAPSVSGEPSVQTKQWEIHLSAQQKYAFRLRANPVKDKGGRRSPITDRSQQVDWLCRKGKLNGFDLLKVSVKTEGVIRGQKRSHNMRFLSVMYHGILKPNDIRLLSEAIATGVGRERAFGFGLLSLSAVKNT